MKRAFEISFSTILSFAIALLTGVFLFFLSGLIKEYSQADDKLTYLLMAVPALVFITTSAIVIYGIPGIVSAAISALLLSTRMGKIPEVATLGTGLIGYLSFKAYLSFGSLFSVSVSNAFPNQIIFKLCGLGFAVSGLVLSLLLGSLQKDTPSVPNRSKQCKRWLRFRVALIALLLLGCIAYFFTHPT